MASVPEFPRASGILLHPTSLPGRFGIGDLGSEAYRFVDQLVEAGQMYWQILPLGPTGFGDSPYQSFSAFAGNLLLVSPEVLVEQGLLDEERIDSLANENGGHVDFGQIYEAKATLIDAACSAFRRDRPEEILSDFQAFLNENAWWLDDHALFTAIKAESGGTPWYEWPEDLRLRYPEAISEATVRHFDSLMAEKFKQYLFFTQWFKLRSYANERGIRLIGDIPIFTALDSADVWCGQKWFKLNKDGTPKVVAGVPPDYFSSTGQLWGNPIYDWDAMRDDDFRWWAARTAFTLRTVDIARIDHFRGFSAVWEVPGGDETAENGEWVNVPGDELFAALERHLGGLPLIAEDLGAITPEVLQLRDKYGFPGMKVLQFAFGGDAFNHDLPHNYPQNCVVYTGTHDNDTTVGWWNSQFSGQEEGTISGASAVPEHCRKYLNIDGSEINWQMIRAAWASVAHTAIVPMQDVLGLGSDARMNFPSSGSGNWAWRLQEGQFTPEVIERLRFMTELYGRTSPRHDEIPEAVDDQQPQDA